MGQQQSKDKLLYRRVKYGNVKGIKALCRDGAGLEWIDKRGRTPLIVACMNPRLYDVAKTLIELGAHIDFCRPGRNGGTALHHAAKRGLERTVKLLLSNGANALLMNDDCQTPLEVARAKGYASVVRAIENHICIFSGWLRELYGPGIVKALVPQVLSRNVLLSRKVWVAVLPTGSLNSAMHFTLVLAIYPSLLDAKPCMVIALWQANLGVPKFRHSDPYVTISSNSIIQGSMRQRQRCRTQIKTPIMLAPKNENDRQQLQAFCNACKGIPQVNSTYMNDPSSNPSSDAISSAPPVSDDVTEDGPIQYPSVDLGPVDVSFPRIHTSDAIPSALPVTDDVTEDGPIQYPPIDLGPVDVSSPSIEQLPGSTSKVKKDKDAISSCVICLDALVEGACVPCGHMAGCMSCLNEVKAKKLDCPVCRAKIDQVIMLYAV